MKIGDIVMCVPALSLDMDSGAREYKAHPAKVVYIHPEKRFFVAEFQYKENFIREAFEFSAEEREEGKEYACRCYYERKRRRWENRHNRKHGGASGAPV